MKNLTIEKSGNSLFLVGHDIQGVVIEISFNEPVEQKALTIAQGLAAAPQLLAENERLRDALESLIMSAEPVFNIYDQDYEQHEMQAGSPSPDGLFIALSAARKALNEQ